MSNSLVRQKWCLFPRRREAVFSQRDGKDSMSLQGKVRADRGTIPCAKLRFPKV